MTTLSLCFLLCSFLTFTWAFRGNNSQNCPHIEEIDSGINVISVGGIESELTATISCKEGYDLEGDSDVYCIEGQWTPYPQCNKRCPPPSKLRNGHFEIDGDKDKNNLYRKGTLVTYVCRAGYYLSPQDKYRICDKGNWTGSDVSCIPNISACPTPNEIPNGYFVYEKTGISDDENNNIGQRLHYGCKTGYGLKGSPVQQCLDDGTWSPKLQPSCIHLEPAFTSSENSDDVPSYAPCPYPPPHHGPYTRVIDNIKSFDEFETKQYAMPGRVIQIECTGKYLNLRNPCQAETLRCIDGRWSGILPNCVLARECDSPPPVLYATAYNLNPAAYETTLTNKYPIKSKISYQCLPGYILQGNEILTCTNNGCWSPSEPPTCYKASIEFNSINALLISAASGVVVSAIFLVFCLITLCRRRKPLSRAVPLPPPIQGPGLGDHATLLHHPDRLALIAFADGIHDQSTLPTYEEATRDRNPGLTVNRLQRPHWPNLASRRARNTPNPDMVHVTRHGSFASHTPSTRSAGDSMGSTDTMAISEGSTNITLDTASSHSGSQPASCRVHCGSLASFDTSSVINTEGVPLLEESELEEIQCGDTVSLVVETHSISDNTSTKLSVASADIS